MDGGHRACGSRAPSLARHASTTLRRRLGTAAFGDVRRAVLRRRRLLSALCAAAAVLAGLQAAAPPPPPTVTVLTAARDLPAGTVLDARTTW